MTRLFIPASAVAIAARGLAVGSLAGRPPERRGVRHPSDDLVACSIG